MSIRKNFPRSDVSKKNFLLQKISRYVFFLPYIIETSAGLNRILLAVLCHSYWEDQENNRIVMKLHPKIAPIKIQYGSKCL